MIPGDLIYWTKQEGRPCHVAVYVGDGYMIDATESGGEIAFRPVEMIKCTVVTKMQNF